MAKIVLLAALLAFVAIQLSHAAPKPDDPTTAPPKSEETKKPVTNLPPPTHPPEAPAGVTEVKVDQAEAETTAAPAEAKPEGKA